MAKHVLFLPSEFPNMDPQNFPEPLTFPKPIGPDLKAELLFKTMYRGPHSTNETVRTKTADDVQKLHTVKSGKRHLTELRRAKQLWRNLINYADMDPNANHLATCTDRPQFSDIPEPLDLPQAQEQLSGVFELWRWFQRHSLDDAATVTSEDAVQDEIVKQVVEFLNSLIKTRYGNRSTISDPWPKLPSNVVPARVFFPVWGRPCNDVRPDRLVRKSGKAGHPDLILYREPKDSRNVCIAEVKPFWAYSDQDFDTVLTNGTARGGRFGWRSKKKKDKAYVLIKQKWGEMIFYGSSWGWSTNGRRIIIFAKTGAHQMAFSRPRSTRNRKLYKALIGLTFAAIDGRSNDGNVDSQDLISRLCGPLDWPTRLDTEDSDTDTCQGTVYDDEEEEEDLEEDGDEESDVSSEVEHTSGDEQHGRVHWDVPDEDSTQDEDEDEDENEDEDEGEGEDEGEDEDEDEGEEDGDGDEDRDRLGNESEEECEDKDD